MSAIVITKKRIVSTQEAGNLQGLPPSDVVVRIKQVLIVTEELVIIGFQELSTSGLVPCQQFLANHKKINANSEI